VRYVRSMPLFSRRFNRSDATPALNLSAEVSNCKVSWGRSLNQRGDRYHATAQRFHFHRMQRMTEGLRQSYRRDVAELSDCSFRGR
jgi:hypothetical protein